MPEIDFDTEVITIPKSSAFFWPIKTMLRGYREAKKQWSDEHDDEHGTLEWAGILAKFVGKFASYSKRFLHQTTPDRSKALKAIGGLYLSIWFWWERRHEAE